MKINFSRICQMTVYGIIFLLTVIYFYTTVDPQVIYFKQQPIFLPDKFFIGYYLYPGSLLSDIAPFFSQFMAYKFTGSVILTLISFFSIVLARWLLGNFFKPAQLFILQYLPFALLIFLFSNYSFEMRSALSFIFTIGFSALFFSLKMRKLIFKLAVLVPLLMISYFLFGILSILTFAALIVIGEFYSRNYKNASVILLVISILTSVTIYYITLQSPYISLKNTFDQINPKEVGKTTSILLGCLYGFAPLLLAVTLVRLFLNKKEAKPVIKQQLLWVILSGTVVLGSIVSFYFAFNAKDKKLTEIHLLASEKKWDEVLKLGAELPADDRKVMYEINRALYHKNLLLEKAFSLNQYFGEYGLILTTHYNSSVLMMCSDLYHDMGHIKESTHWAFEAQTKFNYAPIVLKRIIENNIIMGNYPIAEEYLNVLDHSIIHKKWVKEYRNYINNDKAVEANPEFALLRSLKPKQDFFANTQNPQVDLYQLMGQNQNNKMAFEYYIAYLMMQNNLARVIPELGRLSKLGYTKIPTHLEEAILLYKVLNKKDQVNLDNYPIGKETMDRFMGYTKILSRYKGNPKGAQAELSEEYSGTYWYYVYYISPATTKREFKTK